MVLLIIKGVSLFCNSLERVCQNSGVWIKIAACPHFLVSLGNFKKSKIFFDSFTLHCPATLSHSKQHSYGCHNILPCVACDLNNLLKYVKCEVLPSCLQVPATSCNNPVQFLLEWCRKNSLPLPEPTRGSRIATLDGLGPSYQGCGDQPSSRCAPPPPPHPSLSSISLKWQQTNVSLCKDQMKSMALGLLTKERGRLHQTRAPAVTSSALTRSNHFGSHHSHLPRAIRVLR